MDIEYTSILIGIFGAFIGIYFKENFRIAKNQKVILAKLCAYLEYEHRQIIYAENNIQLIKSFNLESPSETKNIYNIDIVDKIIIETKSKCKVFTDKIANLENNKDYKIQIFEIYKQIKTESIELSGNHKAELQQSIDDIKNNISFISDDEAAQLGYKLTYLIIHYKNCQVSVTKSYLKLLSFVEHSEEFEYEKFNALLWKFIEEFSCLLNLFDVLVVRTKNSSKSNTTVLAIRNIFS